MRAGIRINQQDSIATVILSRRAIIADDNPVSQRYGHGLGTLSVHARRQHSAAHDYTSGPQHTQYPSRAQVRRPAQSCSLGSAETHDRKHPSGYWYVIAIDGLPPPVLQL